MDPENSTRWQLYSEMVRTWVPIVVSLCAISLTVFQANATREHMRLSVKPRLDWIIDIEKSGAIHYSLVNSGLGPADLREVTLLVDGKPVGPDGPATCAAVDTLLGREGDRWETKCFDMVGDIVVPAGDRLLVYGSEAASPGAPPAPLSPSDYLRLTIAGRYCSFYEECWPLQ